MPVPHHESASSLTKAPVVRCRSQSPGIRPLPFLVATLAILFTLSSLPARADGAFGGSSATGGASQIGDQVNNANVYGQPIDPWAENYPPPGSKGSPAVFGTCTFVTTQSDTIDTPCAHVQLALVDESGKAVGHATTSNQGKFVFLMPRQTSDGPAHSLRFRVDSRDFELKSSPSSVMLGQGPIGLTLLWKKGN